MTQEQLADRAGVSSRTVRDLELGRVARPRAATIRLLIDALGLTETEKASVAALACEPGAIGRPNQLPAGHAHFVGRSEHLQLLDALPATVTVALHGAAGVGKTALAIHWADRVQDRFPDGRLYVNLLGYASGPLRSPLDAVCQLLRALGISVESIPLDLDAATAMYRSVLTGRRLLIVLDNVRNAEQVRPLLAGGCATIITSRDRLNGLAASHGIRRLSLPVLTRAESMGLLTSILGADRVGAESTAASELIDLCASLPLALQIAAANLAARPQLGIGEGVAALRDGDRLAALETGDDAGSAVRNAFDHSYLVLPPEAQLLFRRLGASPNRDHTPATAAVVAEISAGSAERLLDQLAAAHLIQEERPLRYGFHDLMRLYAKRRWEAEETAEQRTTAMARLHQWYLRSTVAAGRLLYPQMLRMPPPECGPAQRFEDQTGALNWINAELANLVAVVSHTAQCGPHSISWTLADNLRGYFTHSRDAVTWLEVAKAGLLGAQAGNQLFAQAACHQSAAQAHHCAGQYVESIQHNNIALTLSQRAGWEQGEATVLNHLGTANLGLGRLHGAADFYRRALDMNRRIGRPAGEASSLGNLAIVHARLGHLRVASDEFVQALDIERQSASLGAQAVTLANLGEVNLQLGQFDVALSYLTQALNAARAVGNMNGEANALIGLAGAYAKAGDFDQAAECSRSAIDMAELTNDRRAQGAAFNIHARILCGLEHYAEAVALHQDALRLAQAIGNRAVEIAAHLGLAHVFLAQSHLDTARAHSELALTTAVQGQYRVFEVEARELLARLAAPPDRDAAVQGHHTTFNF